MNDLHRPDAWVEYHHAAGDLLPTLATLISLSGQTLDSTPADPEAALAFYCDVVIEIDRRFQLEEHEATRVEQTPDLQPSLWQRGLW